MDLTQTLGLSNSVQTNNIGEKQNSFLSSTLGKVINTGLNLGIRALLPNVIEDQVIEIKDAILNNGFKDGIKQAISSAVEFGKSALGIVTGKFDNISQAHNAIKSGGIIDSVSDALNFAIDKGMKNNVIPETTGILIKKGKNVILQTIESNIENNFNQQMNSLEYLGKYENNWNNYFKKQDFEGMEREYRKIKDTMKKILPIEQTLERARTIENLHLLIKNNGQNFNLTSEQLALANKL